MTTFISASGVTVGQLVAERPSRARVFERHGIDYCCGGKLSLAEACAKRGLDLQSILVELDRSTDEKGPDVDWTAVSMTALADHIERTHHDFLRTELPRLSALSAKVAARHGDAMPELVELAGVFDGFAEELFDHMRKEEVVLFPAIRALERGATPGAGPARLGAPIGCMVHEHEDAGEALARMRRLTGGFSPPADACNTYRALFDGLAAIERDMHTHVHKENNILFPRALSVEAALGRS